MAWDMVEGMDEPGWDNRQGRGYDSSGRKKNAEERQDTIIEAARQLFREHGFAATTIFSIAAAAGVSAPTVYAAFSSKRGILKAILKKARFNPEYEAIVARVNEQTDILERMRTIAAIVRSVYEGEQKEMDFLAGSGIVDPDIAAIQSEQEVERKERQRHNIDLLVEKGLLKKALDIQSARDLLWTLTSREVYRMLAVECGWGAEKYEGWLARTLVESLVEGGGEKSGNT